MPRAPPRQVASDDEEAEEVREHVRTGHDGQGARGDEENRGDHQPNHVTVAILAQRRPHHLQGLLGSHVVGMMQRRVGVLAQVPEQALLVDVLRDGPQDALLHPPEPRRGDRRLLTARAPAPVFLGVGQHLPETVHQPAKQSTLLKGVHRRRVLGGLAIGLETAPADRDEVDVEHVIRT